MDDPDNQTGAESRAHAGACQAKSQNVNPGYSGRDNLHAMRHARNYNNFLLKLIRAHATPQDQVLDFGAGLGFFASELRKQALDVICVEADSYMADEINSKGIKCFRSIENVASESIDFIYTLNVLEHIEDDESTVSMLATKLKPGGRLLVYVPAFPVLFSKMDLEVGHFRRYTTQSLQELLHSSSLKIDRIEYADSIGFPATLAYKLLSNTGRVEQTQLELYDRFVFPVSRMVDRATRNWFGKNIIAIARKSVSA